MTEAFSHWTWRHTNGRLLLCDLQGTQKDGGWLFTDPAIHSLCTDGSSSACPPLVAIEEDDEEEPSGNLVSKFIARVWRGGQGRRTNSSGDVRFGGTDIGETASPCSSGIKDAMTLAITSSSRRKCAMLATSLPRRTSYRSELVRASVTSHDQVGGTCHANEVATVVRAAESRTVGRSLEGHAAVVNRIVAQYGSDGGVVETVLEQECRVVSCHLRRCANEEHKMRSTKAVHWCARSTFQTNSGRSFHRSSGQSHRKCFPLSALSTRMLNWRHLGQEGRCLANQEFLGPRFRAQRVFHGEERRSELQLL